MPARMPPPSVRSLLPGPQDLPVPPVQQESSPQTSLGPPDTYPDPRQVRAWIPGPTLGPQLSLPQGPAALAATTPRPRPRQGLHAPERRASSHLQAKLSLLLFSWVLSLIPSWNRAPTLGLIHLEWSLSARFCQAKLATLAQLLAPRCVLFSVCILTPFRAQEALMADPNLAPCQGPSLPRLCSLVPTHEPGSSEFLS